MNYISNFSFLILLLLSTAVQSYGQSVEYLIIVNGGQFGSTNYANIGIKDLSTNTFQSIDTIYETSVQDILLENNTIAGGGNNYAYVAAQDSIIKYDLISGTRIAANAFGAPSTIKLSKYNNKLIVGNWYKPFGWSGSYTNHLRIFDSNTLAFIDSIPQVDKPAKDIAVVGDYAYIAQNNAKTVGFGDTLGYLAVVDMTTMAWIRNDTLSAMGHEIGRLVVDDSIIYALNGASNTISSYNTTTMQGMTQSTTVDLQPIGYGSTAYEDSQNAGVWFFPFDSGLGSYNLATNTIVNPSIVKIDGSFAFTHNFATNSFCVSHFDFLNQSNNRGVIYDMNGDSINTFPVGISPEVLALYSSVGNSTTSLQAAVSLDCQLFPNPAQDRLQVKQQTTDKLHLSIFNQLGQYLGGQTTTANQTSINIQDLPLGQYILHITNSSGQVQSIPFVKQ